MHVFIATFNVSTACIARTSCAVYCVPVRECQARANQGILVQQCVECDLTVMSEEKKPFERLSTDVVPVNYKVELRPDLKAFTFQGKLEITAKVRV